MSNISTKINLAGLVHAVQTKKSKFRLRSFFDANYDKVKAEMMVKAEQYVNLLA